MLMNRFLTSCCLLATLLCLTACPTPPKPKALYGLESESKDAISNFIDSLETGKKIHEVNAEEILLSDTAFLHLRPRVMKVLKQNNLIEETGWNGYNEGWEAHYSQDKECIRSHITLAHKLKDGKWFLEGFSTITVDDQTKVASYHFFWKPDSLQFKDLGEILPSLVETD